MNDTFHYFTELPSELGNQIWNLAIRPARPGVQIFKLYSPETKGSVGNAMDVVFDYYSIYDNYRIAVPNCDDKNQSTYLIDGALWNTCKESRRVMDHMPEQREQDAPAIGYFKNHAGDTRYLTVLPHQDLFLFQLKDPATIDWERLDMEILLGSSTWGFQGRRNIALEYKTEWGLQLGKNMAELYNVPIIGNIIRMAIDSEASLAIWLVDYNLRRKRNVAASISNGEKPRTFYARNHRLIEYIEEVEVEEDDSNEFLKEISNSITFADTVHEAAINQRESWESHNKYPCPIGLLGWDTL
ncbi:hypothetical protein CDV36_002594 [Fusarium kuroshium]|uniref:2EXR domain-containing protein n=1 Tax=Fusarium kuroshium TaxID=2010991 RepID=A0A3M2SJF9_9HYPO|nr:hypothetical protein CDV36_002594 [Fusarium kuroshium]